MRRLHRAERSGSDSSRGRAAALTALLAISPFVAAHKVVSLRHFNFTDSMPRCRSNEGIMITLQPVASLLVSSFIFSAAIAFPAHAAQMQFGGIWRDRPWYMSERTVITEVEDGSHWAFFVRVDGENVPISINAVDGRKHLMAGSRPLTHVGLLAWRDVDERAGPSSGDRLPLPLGGGAMSTNGQTGSPALR
jgi:hypothetical protein